MKHFNLIILLAALGLWSGGCNSATSNDDSDSDTSVGTGLDSNTDITENTDNDTDTVVNNDDTAKDSEKDTAGDSDKDTTTSEDTYYGLTCSGERIPVDDINCLDTDGNAIEDCMRPCGDAVAWGDGFECPSNLICADGGCVDTDDASGYCYPPLELVCETDEDCECLPSPCQRGDYGTLYWRCENKTCESIYIRNK